MYYWDSYWIVLGLLVSRMTETATVGPCATASPCSAHLGGSRLCALGQAVVSNLVELLQEYGHVPNGEHAHKCYGRLL